MQRLRFGAGSVSVEMDDTLERIYRRALEDVHPGLLDAIQGEVEPIYRDVLKRWPIGKERPDRPYHSISRFRQAVTITPDHSTVRGTITNDAPWARFVAPVNLWGRNGFVELLRKPMRKAHRRIATKVAKQAAERLAGDA